MRTKVKMKLKMWKRRGGEEDRVTVLRERRVVVRW